MLLPTRGADRRVNVEGPAHFEVQLVNRSKVVLRGVVSHLNSTQGLNVRKVMTSVCSVVELLTSLRFERGRVRLLSGQLVNRVFHLVFGELPPQRGLVRGVELKQFQARVRRLTRGEQVAGELRWNVLDGLQGDCLALLLFLLV